MEAWLSNNYPLGLPYIEVFLAIKYYLVNMVKKKLKYFTLYLEI